MANCLIKFSGMIVIATKRSQDTQSPQKRQAPVMTIQKNHCNLQTVVYFMFLLVCLAKTTVIAHYLGKAILLITYSTFKQTPERYTPANTCLIN